MMVAPYVQMDEPKMTTLIITLFIATLLPYVAKIPLAYAMHKSGGYNNHYPREQQARLTGFGARAMAAHQNSFESLIVFSTAVLANLATDNVNPMIEQLAIAYIVLRVVYYFMYWYNLATLRSTVWFLGLLCSLTMLWHCVPH